ncbi:head completion/stabilization protein, partial [Escherichia coli]|uniref:head completion/stabilization protein n=1 Tax=Escherichia coli TaxID=562 RepID=UPI00227E055D
MSTVVIQRPRPDAPAPRPEDEPIVKNVFFWPDIDPADVRDVMRIEGTITAPRLRLAIKSAIAEVNAELFTFRRDQMADGYQRLEDVPGEQLDGESVRVSEYRNAVSSMTMATLSEQYRSFD